MAAAVPQKAVPTGAFSMTGMLRNSDLAVAVMAVTIVVMMVVPLPPAILDLMITLNIGSSLMILLVSLYASEPLEFASFPTMLLLATLFRLALNVSATRLILLHAHAGAVVDAFGQFVVGGNYIVGVVLFLLLIIIQFVVITQGAGRVAEVAARFTLDAMPGKQMAIDADLNAGLISEDGARTRRLKIQHEADFYGAMDGASKFVKGDAMAAMIMVVVNILGGFAVGMIQMQMDLMQALQTFTILTVGEGLVSQISALLLSTATGIIVTRAASDDHLGQQFLGQTLSQPRAVMVASGVMLTLALVPGLPKLPFLLIAGGLWGIGRVLSMETPVPVPAADELAAAGADGPPAEAGVSADDIQRALLVDPLEVEIGYGLVRLADPQHGGHLLGRVSLMRRQLAQELGLVVPPVRVRDNAQLKSNTYVIKLRGVEVGRSDLYPRQFLAMDPGGGATEGAPGLRGIPATEPAFGLPAIWVDEQTRQAAELSGYTVVDPLTVVITHLTEIIRRHSAEILSRQSVQELVDGVREKTPAVVMGIIPDLLTLVDVQKVLQNLLRERVSIRDLTAVLEALGDAARFTKNIDALTEDARRALARTLCQANEAPDGKLHVVMLDPRTEQFLIDRVRTTEQGSHLLLDQTDREEFLQQVHDTLERVVAMGYSPILLCSPRTRLHVHRMVERVIPHLVVLSYSELVPEVEVQSQGVVRMDR